MTSVIRSYRNGSRLPNPIGCVILKYSNKPVPFTFDNSSGTLDIDFSSGFTATTNANEDDYYVRGQPFTAINLIENLGRNFIQWCESSSNINAKPGSVRIYEKGLVVQANILQNNLQPDDVWATEERDTPISFDTAVGDSSNEYLSTYLFVKPLVITYLKSDGEPQPTYTRKYRVFTSQLGEQNT
jgi:hypothetical protein